MSEIMVQVPDSFRELGYSDDEITDLEDEGIIGTAPAGLTIRTTKTG